MKSPRRDQLKSLLLGGGAESPPPPGTGQEAKQEAGHQAGQGSAPAPEVKSATPPAGNPPVVAPRIRSLQPERTISGSVKAMSRSLGELGAAAEEAARLRSQLANAEAIVAVDPALVDPSFVADRLEAPESEEGRAFLEDVRAHGQQVPVLLRPHPDKEGRYQIAYGHRRLWAARRLGIPVRAQVRSLTDAELVIAQGQENAQRRDLSFIEKAMFARALDEREFDRATLMAALAVQTAEITRLLAVARAMPPALAAAIGPAPKAGRPRWMALAEAVEQGGAARALAALAAAPAVTDSDARFTLAFAAATQRAASPAQGEDRLVLKDGNRGLVRLKLQGTRASLAFEDAGFAEYLANRMRPLHAEWIALRKSAGLKS